MKIIPKYASGDTITFNSFDVLQPVQAQTLRRAKAASSKSGDDGSLSEKDFFNMFKDLDGLPNEMLLLVGKFSNIFRYSSLTGDSVYDLSTMYMMALTDLKTANWNKTKYDNTMKDVATNGSLYEPAISINNKFFTIDSDGDLEEVDPDVYVRSPNDYLVLTVSQLMYLRAYDPSFAYNPELFNIAENSMGYESFQALLDKAITKVGTSLVASDTKYAVDPAETEELIRQLGTLGVDYYSLKSSGLSLDSLNLINALLTYIANVMPRRALAWAMYKTNDPDGIHALLNLAFLLLSGQTSTVSKTTEQEDPKGAKKGSGSNKDAVASTLIGFWGTVMNGKVGEEKEFVVGVDQGITAVDRARLVPPIQGSGLDKGEMSVKQYITESGIPSKGVVAIASYKLDSDSYDKVVIDPTAGMYVVELPKTMTGAPAFGVAALFAEALREIIQAQSEGRPVDYAKILSDNGIDELYDKQTGKWDHSKMENYVVLTGLASGDAEVEVVYPDPMTGLLTHSHVPLTDSKVNQAYIKEIDNPTTAQRSIFAKALGDDSLKKSKEKLYKVLIYIPILHNQVTAALADKVNITNEVSTRYAAGELTWVDTHGNMNIPYGGMPDDNDMLDLTIPPRPQQKQSR